jgi:hypothetical protein
MVLVADISFIIASTPCAACNACAAGCNLVGGTGMKWQRRPCKHSCACSTTYRIPWSHHAPLACARYARSLPHHGPSGPVMCAVCLNWSYMRCLTVVMSSTRAHVGRRSHKVARRAAMLASRSLKGPACLVALSASVQQPELIQRSQPAGSLTASSKDGQQQQGLDAFSSSSGSNTAASPEQHRCTQAVTHCIGMGGKAAKVPDILCT